MTQENSRDAILQTSCRLFAKKGYDAVGVQEIADTVKITKPTMYYYFGSKLGILQALILEKGEKLFARLKTACQSKDQFFESMQKIIKTEIDFAKSEPDYFHLHRVLLAAPKDSEYFEPYEKLRKGLEELFLQFFKDSAAVFGNMRGKELLYSTLFHNQLLSITENVLEGKIEPSDDVVYQITHSFIYGFAD